MASPNGPSDQFAPVLRALTTMQGSVDRDQKYQATQFLEEFQKSVGYYSETLAFSVPGEVGWRGYFGRSLCVRLGSQDDGGVIGGCGVTLQADEHDGEEKDAS